MSKTISDNRYQEDMFYVLIPGVSHLMFHSDTVRRSIEKKQKKVREREVKLSQLQQSVNQLTSEKLKIEADMQDRKQMEDTMADLTDKNSTLASQIQVSYSCYTIFVAYKAASKFWLI